MSLVVSIKYKSSLLENLIKMFEYVKLQHYGDITISYAVKIVQIYSILICAI